MASDDNADRTLPDSGFKSWMFVGMFDTIRALLADADLRKTPDPNFYWGSSVLRHPSCPHGNESVLWWGGTRSDAAISRISFHGGSFAAVTRPSRSDSSQSSAVSVAQELLDAASEPELLVYILEPGGLGTGNDHYLKQFQKGLLHQNAANGTTMTNSGARTGTTSGATTSGTARPKRLSRIFCVLHKPGIVNGLAKKDSKNLIFTDSMYTRDCVKEVKRLFGSRTRIALVGVSIGGLCTFKSAKDILRTNATGLSRSGARTNQFELEEVRLPAVVCVDFPIDLLGLFRSYWRNRVYRMDHVFAWVTWLHLHRFASIYRPSLKNTAVGQLESVLLGKQRKRCSTSLGLLPESDADEKRIQEGLDKKSREGLEENSQAEGSSPPDSPQGGSPQRKSSVSDPAASLSGYQYLLGIGRSRVGSSREDFDRQFRIELDDVIVPEKPLSGDRSSHSRSSGTTAEAQSRNSRRQLFELPLELESPAPDNFLVIYSANDPIITPGFRYIEVCKHHFARRNKFSTDAGEKSNQHASEISYIAANVWECSRGGHCGSFLRYSDLASRVDEWVVSRFAST